MENKINQIIYQNFKIYKKAVLALYANKDGDDVDLVVKSLTFRIICSLSKLVFPDCKKCIYDENQCPILNRLFDEAGIERRCEEE